MECIGLPGFLIRLRIVFENHGEHGQREKMKEKEKGLLRMVKEIVHNEEAAARVPVVQTRVLHCWILFKPIMVEPSGLGRVPR
jgi:hypothetical protein